MKTADIVRLGLLTALAGGVYVLMHLSKSGDSANAGPPGELIDFKLLDRTERKQGASNTGATVAYPPELSALDNKKISIVGFMVPYEELDNMRHFMLLPSYVGCYFCSPPSFTQVVLVEQGSKEEGKLPFINDPITVTGTLKLYAKDSQHPAHKAEFVYAIDEASVSVYTGKDLPQRAGPQQQKTLLNVPLVSNTAAPGSPPQHKAFQPQFLVTAVSDLRKLPMMRPVKFLPEEESALERRISDLVYARHTGEEWQERERAYIALGFADASFDLPRTVTGIELGRCPGIYDAKADVIYYNKDLKLSQPDARKQMVKLIAYALVAQNVSQMPTGSAIDDDGALAPAALLQGDVDILATRYDEKTRLLSTASNAAATIPPGFPPPPPALERLAALQYSAAANFVAKDFPADQPDKLNAAYDKPPQSMTQVLHPELYLDAKGWTPQPVSWPEGQALLQGQKPIYSGVLGEAGLMAWLGRIPGSQPKATGWQGDRYAVWTGGKDGDSWLMETHWTDKGAAKEFFSSAKAAITGGNSPATPNEVDSDDRYQTHAAGRAFRLILPKDSSQVYVLSATSDEAAEALAKQLVK